MSAERSSKDAPTDRGMLLQYLRQLERQKQIDDQYRFIAELQRGRLETCLELDLLQTLYATQRSYEKERDPYS